MDNWKIVLWLVLFFPFGLYLMFKHSEWSQKVKVTISIFFLIITVGALGFLSELMYLSGFIALLASLHTFIKKKDKRRSLILVAIGMLFFATTATTNYQINQAQERERIAIELQEQKEAERLAQEKHEKELAAKEEQKRIEEEEKLKAQEEMKQRAVKAIEKAEKEPIKQNYDLALQNLNKLDKAESELTTRLDKVKPIMEKYEEEKLVIVAAIEKAEGDKSRSSYDEAHGLLTALAFSNSSFTNRLGKLDDEITLIEKEKVVAEKKEVERIAAEAEAIRIEAEAEAARVIAVEAESARVAAEEAAAVVVAPEEDQITNVVYIAPDTGTKYHYHSNCRGLSNANSIVEMDLSTAQSQGYELCGWED